MGLLYHKTRPHRTIHQVANPPKAKAPNQQLSVQYHDNLNLHHQETPLSRVPSFHMKMTGSKTLIIHHHSKDHPSAKPIPHLPSLDRLVDRVNNAEPPSTSSLR